MTDSKRLFVYEATISRSEVESKLTTTISDSEWLNLCEFMGDTYPRIGNFTFASETLARVLDYYRTTSQEA